MAQSPILYLYMLTNRKPGTATVTQLGCSSDVTERLALYNNPVPGPGSDRRARQAAGYWRPILIIVVAEGTGLSGRALVEQWKAKSRKIHCRFAYGVQMARSLHLPYMVDVEELQQDDRITSKESKLVAELVGAATDDPVRVRHIVHAATANSSPSSSAAAAAAPAAVPVPVPVAKVFDGLSFARTDRPRDRYKRRRLVAIKEEDRNEQREPPRDVPLHVLLAQSLCAQ